MADFTTLAAVASAAVYDFAPIRTVVDVGGGNGALLIGILKAHPHLHGTVFDRPPAAERARKQIGRPGTRRAMRAVGGDFFTQVPQGAERYILKARHPDWNASGALVILENCRRAMGRRAGC